MIHIITGGTVFHVRPHLALCAPAYGTVGRKLADIIEEEMPEQETLLHSTRMAGGDDLETNDDIEKLLSNIINDPLAKIVFMPVALCDYKGFILEDTKDSVSGKSQPRLKTSDGIQLMKISPSEKIISNIRRKRKDIFLVGFKTTSGATEDEQFLAGLKLLKSSSCNLVLANDIQTRINMIITPEQARYGVTANRDEALKQLVDMTKKRSALRFTRSKVVDGQIIKWHSDMVPNTLRTVVNYCISKNAYKPFLGATVGHFAVKISDNEFLTSIRKSDFNKLQEGGLVYVKTEGENNVTAFGHKPSVGGQSQRIVFANHLDTDCIVHFHCKLKAGSKVSGIPIRSQYEYECGSHECGRNTSDGLQKFGNLYAVMLDKHGPNIVFSREINPQEVIDFIEENFDLGSSTDEVNWSAVRWNQESGAAMVS